MKPKVKGSIYKRGSVYWVKYYRNGKPYRESSGSEREADASRLLRKRQGEISLGQFHGPDAEKVTLKDLSRDFLADYEVNGKKSKDKADRSVNHLLDFFGEGCKAHQLTTAQVRAYQAARLGNKVENGTINRELAALKRMFNLGIQGGKINRKPYIPLLAENNVRTGFFEYGDFLALRDALPESLRPIVTFAYYTGCRKQEILSLRWSQVDLQARTVRLDPGTTKNGEGRVLALEGELLEVMKGQWEARKVWEIPGHPVTLCPWVFHRNGEPIRSFRVVWATACKETGLVGKLFHDFRRSAVRNMVRAGIPERVVMMVSGHKTRSVMERYNIVSEEDLREAARKTAAYTQAQETASKVVPFQREAVSR